MQLLPNTMAILNGLKAAKRLYKIIDKIAVIADIKKLGMRKDSI